VLVCVLDRVAVGHAPRARAAVAHAPVLALRERAPLARTREIEREAVLGSLGGNRAKHFWIAQGSASEVKAALHTAVAWGWVGQPGTALAVLDRLLALLWGLTHPSDARLGR
jgi:hypothetical protein